MKLDNITVDIEANLNVSKSTAEACLKLVEIYLKNNPNIELNKWFDEDGNLELEFEPVEDDELQTDHDGCEGCKYDCLSEYEYPCTECKHNHTDKWVSAKL